MKTNFGNEIAGKAEWISIFILKFLFLTLSSQNNIVSNVISFIDTVDYYVVNKSILLTLRK